MSKKRITTQAAQVPKHLALPNAPSTSNADRSSGEVTQELTKSDQSLARVHRAFATTDLHLVVQLLLDAKQAAGVDQNSTNGHKFIVAAVDSLNPLDGMEALLATQMVAVHRHAMRCLANAAAREQPVMTSELYTNRANRLLRMFTTQMEALKKYRSKGEQHFTVEHVHVHSGGKAVVGVVRQRKGRGDGGGPNENEK